MAGYSLIRRYLCILTTAYAVLSMPAVSAESTPVRVYEVTTVTGMPHLEEGLRYSTTRETRAFSPRDFATAFPILQHPALKGCRLDPGKRESNVVI